MGKLSTFLCTGILLSLPAAGVLAQQQTKLPADDLNPNFQPPAQQTDFDKRVVMIPMRDGVKLYTVIVVPKGAQDAPIILTRTPYDAAHAPNARRAADDRVAAARR